MEALLRAGFRIRSRGDGIAVLVRGTSVVMIPDVETIEAEMLQSILRSAGVSRMVLDEHLAHVPKRSGFFAKHRAVTLPTADEGRAPASKRRG